MGNRLRKNWKWSVAGLLLSGAVLAIEDPFLWLEEIRGASAIQWVESHNLSTTTRLEAHHAYATIEAEARSILTAKDRIPGIRKIGSRVYNFWQDTDHPQGILRRTTLSDYETVSPIWETVLDLDALSQQESKRWVYKGLDCLAPAYERCLLSISDGGKDAVVIREFDLLTKDFVHGGFTVPEAKTGIVWMDADRVAIGTDFGPGSLTDSGYPRQIRIWKRGELLSGATLVFEGQKQDVTVSVSSILGQSAVLISRGLDFFTREMWVLDRAGSLRTWRVPVDAQLLGITRNFAFFSRRLDWMLPSGATALIGSLVSFPISSAGELDPAGSRVVWQPTPSSSLQGLAVTRDHAILNVRENVRSRVYRLRQDASASSGWQLDPLPHPTSGLVSFSSVWEGSDEGVLTFQDFLTPPTTFLVDFATGVLRKLKSTPERFDASTLEAEQLFATSFDGARIPYFIIHPKGMKLDGMHPTILTGYGGFMIPMTPFYAGAIGKIWLERGGVYVVANIRGGGEYGPAWHEAARREKRQVAFNDFYAVAEDLIRRKITSPGHLGIEGGSNGGLLVGTAFTQRPELFGAVVCSVPLLDMLRYHRLLAGASWVGEYGNPDDPKDRVFLERYSPYQNAAAGKAYPEVFFTGSTADDRVHPGHARKMAAKLESLGYPVLFYENTEGGHSGAANLEQRIRMQALQMTYFADKLGL
jgi:prolyl oligopeptidase